MALHCIAIQQTQHDEERIWTVTICCIKPLEYKTAICVYLTDVKTKNADFIVSQNPVKDHRRWHLWLNEKLQENKENNFTSQAADIFWSLLH